MKDIVQEYIEGMKTAPDQQYPGNEWDIVNELLANPPSEFDAILLWIFEEHKGYVAPRVQAGLKFVERNPEEGIVIIKRLVNSDDPDDRDTAIPYLWVLMIDIK